MAAAFHKASETLSMSSHPGKAEFAQSAFPASQQAENGSQVKKSSQVHLPILSQLDQGILQAKQEDRERHEQELEN